MLVVGSTSREAASQVFPFLAPKFHGRRRAIKEFTHLAPDFVFWVYPDGTLFDAKEAHRKNIPRGYEEILNDAPRYGGFLRGRVASNFGPQLIVVYCEPEALAVPGASLIQFLAALGQMPVPISRDTLVISDNGDIYGSVQDLHIRMDDV